MASRSRRHTRDWGLYLGLAAFAIAFGHLEAVAAVYMREFLGIVPTPGHLDIDGLEQMPGWLVATGQTREAATIVVLGALALVGGRTGRQRLGVFLYTFGIWDVVYYISLKVMTDWPSGLATVDCIFLIPQAWYAPVWVPISISLVMIIWGTRFMTTFSRRVRK